MIEDLPLSGTAIAKVGYDPGEKNEQVRQVLMLAAGFITECEKLWGAGQVRKEDIPALKVAAHLVQSAAKIFEDAAKNG